MSLDLAIESGRERRREFRGSKAKDATCRCHGSCSRCRRNRLRSATVREQAAAEQMREATT